MHTYSFLTRQIPLNALYLSITMPVRSHHSASWSYAAFWMGVLPPRIWTISLSKILCRAKYLKDLASLCKYKTIMCHLVNIWTNFNIEIKFF